MDRVYIEKGWYTMWNVIFAIIIIAGIRIAWEVRNFKVTHYSITSVKFPSNFPDYKIVMLSDLHNRSYGIGNRKLLTAVEELKPDCILIAGDMIVGKKTADFGQTLEFLKQLAVKYPVYYANGNHESRMKFETEKFGSMYKTFQSAILDYGITLLENENATILIPECPARIYGLEIDNEYYKKRKTPVMNVSNIKQQIGIPDQQEYSILLAHNPVYFPLYAEWGADLVLSGHVHGGLARIPFLGGMLSPQLKFFPKYDAGLFEEKSSKMILSRGIGSHSIHIRLFNQPEIVAITLTNH